MYAVLILCKQSTPVIGLDIFHIILNVIITFFYIIRCIAYIIDT